MLNQKDITSILKKNKIKIDFVGKLDLRNGSDRIFCNSFSKFLNKQKNCISEIIENNQGILTVTLQSLKEFPSKRTEKVFK